MVRLASLCLSLLIIAAVAGPAQAERRLALVIGNGDYVVGPLDNPTNDAALMAETLRASGFEVTHVENLGYRDLQRAVVGFGRDLRSAGDDTVGMVFYAGHAVQADGENYLIPVDADIQDELDLEIATLRVSTLMASLEKAGNRMNMVVLDACRNNPFKSMSRSGSRGLAKIDAASGTLLAYSTAPGRVAADGAGRNSPYTAALVKAMRTPGLPVEQVFKRVRVEVMEKTGEQQVPWESSSLTGDFSFIDAAPVIAAPTPAPAAPDNSAEIALWTSIATSTDPALFQSYLDAYPNGVFAGVAKQRIASLRAAQAQAGERAARQAREAEARAVWDSVQDSGDPALLRSVIDRYGDTIYAQLAAVKIEALNAQSQARATAPAQQQASVNDQRAETLFWDAIKNSSNRADYQAYLEQYPDGTFAAIARNRAENGYQPQVAALTSPSSAHPYDGDWLFTWKVVGGYYGGVSWCSPSEEGTVKVTVKEGKWEGRFVSNFSGSARVKIDVSESGGGTFFAKVPGWSTGTMRMKFDLSNGSDDVEADFSGFCVPFLEIRRE